jgi:arsenite methyltransferase
LEVEMETKDNDQVRAQVRTAYARVAKGADGCSVVATQAIPKEVTYSVEALTGCVAGAAPVEEVRALLAGAGFEAVKVEARRDSDSILAQCMPGAGSFLASAVIEGKKPGGASCCGPSCCT